MCYQVEENYKLSTESYVNFDNVVLLSVLALHVHLTCRQVFIITAYITMRAVQSYVRLNQKRLKVTLSMTSKIRTQKYLHKKCIICIKYAYYAPDRGHSLDLLVQ